MPASFPVDLASHVHAQLTHRKETPPSTKVLTRLFETLYFASLKREETQPISCRIAFIDRKHPDPLSSFVHSPPPLSRLVTDLGCFSFSPAVVAAWFIKAKSGSSHPKDLTGFHDQRTVNLTRP